MNGTNHFASLEVSSSVPRRVDLFVTCVVDALAPEVGVATVGVLRNAACVVDVPSGQTCCGQPAWNAGFVAEAAQVARASLRALVGADGLGPDGDGDAIGGAGGDDGDVRGGGDQAPTVVVPAGSCAAMIRNHWEELFTMDGDQESARLARGVAARTMELTEFLGTVVAQPGSDQRASADDVSEVASGTDAGAHIAPTDSAPTSAPTAAPAEHGPGTPNSTRAYHRSCHMERELGLHHEPIDALKMAGITCADWPEDDRCCGFGGTFAARLPEVSTAMADDKLDSIPVGVDVVVGADSSCLMHLASRAARRGDTTQFVHIANVLADCELPGPSQARQPSQP